MLRCHCCCCCCNCRCQRCCCHCCCCHCCCCCCGPRKCLLHHSPHSTSNAGACTRFLYDMPGILHSHSSQPENVLDTSRPEQQSFVRGSFSSASSPSSMHLTCTNSSIKSNSILDSQLVLVRNSVFVLLNKCWLVVLLALWQPGQRIFRVSALRAMRIRYSPIYPGSIFENTYNFLSIPPNSRNWNGIGNGLGMGK